MDSFTLNKIAGAVLGSCLLGVGLGVIGDFIYAPSVPTKPGYALPEPKPEAAGGTAAKAPDVTPLPVLLAKADPKKGEADTKVCGACHNFQEGAGTKVGPDLYGVVGRPKGSVAGFDYSAAMKAKGGNWEFADINAFITKPSAYVQGTKMGYAGEDNPEKRADIISYLRTLSKSPLPLPAVADAGPAAAAAPPTAAPPASAAPPMPASPKPEAKPQSAPVPPASPKPEPIAEPQGPEPYVGADPQYPQAEPDASAPTAPSQAPEPIVESSPPEPYVGADPQYPQAEPDASAPAALSQAPEPIVESSPPEPYVGADPQYPQAEPDAAAPISPSQTPEPIAESSPPEPYVGADPQYPETQPRADHPELAPEPINAASQPKP